MFTPSPSTVVVQDGERWLLFAQPVAVVAAHTPAEVLPALHRAVQAIEDDGLHAAGFITYEAAPGFDPALVVRPPGPLPLLWFGLYRPPEVWDRLPAGERYVLGEWQASQAFAGYRRAIDQIKDAIARGDTYQVNYTIALRARWEGDAWGLRRPGRTCYLFGLAGVVPGHRRRPDRVQADEGHRATRPHPG